MEWFVVLLESWKITWQLSPRKLQSENLPRHRMWTPHDMSSHLVSQPPASVSGSGGRVPISPSSCPCRCLLEPHPKSPRRIVSEPRGTTYPRKAPCRAKENKGWASPSAAGRLRAETTKRKHFFSDVYEWGPDCYYIDVSPLVDKWIFNHWIPCQCISDLVYVLYFKSRN